ncbi:MAG: hypothetical protein ACUVXI_06085 [bacterium]
MELMYKEDWEACRERIDAWWHGEIIDRAPIKITAPRMAIESQAEIDDLEAYWTDPERVIPRLERQIEATYWAGEAFPVMFPVSTGMVAILGSYLGCPLKFVDTRTTWAEHIIDDWERRPKLEFDPENKWWRLSSHLLESAAQRAPGRYYVGLPDLNGPGEILSRLRGPDRLAIDLIENGDYVKKALKEINRAWLRYWEACVGIIHQHVGGYITWMGIWSESPSTDLQCDFSIMISKEMFDEFFLPGIEQQTEWIGRTIYHLDGPGAVRHLDSLLDLPKLSGIQWVPGAGAPPMREWIPLLKKIQGAGKLLYIDCEKEEVEYLLTELRPEGLLLNTHCDSAPEADALLKRVERLTARR